MKNYKNMKTIIFSLLIICLSCKEVSDTDFKVVSQKEVKNLNRKKVADTNFGKSVHRGIEITTDINLRDSVIIDVDDNYNMKITSNKEKVRNINYFSSIKNKLIREESYVQIIYNKDNIVINLEIGRNADIYEDIYLSKKEPIIIQKIIRTTIDKTNNSTKKIICQDIFNQPLSISKYIIDLNLKNCRVEEM